MKQIFGKILVAIDGSHSCLRAREIAASIAREFGSKVTVVHVISHDFMHPELKAHHQLPSLILHELDKSYQKAGRKIIRAAEEFFREENVEIKSELVKAEDPAEKVLQMVKESDYDLLIIGNISETQADRFSLGSVAEKISLYAKCPVLIAKRKTKIKKLLVAVDGSEKADKALEYAIQLCRHFKARMTLLHVEEGELFRLEPKVTKQVGEQILAESASKAKAGDVACDVRLEFGNPARTILKVAKQEDYDLIVLGSRGVSSVKRFLLGSVSADVSMHAQRSVLIVR
jgi:nucleotide-binding universal stress UspA family protein